MVDWYAQLGRRGNTTNGNDMYRWNHPNRPTIGRDNALSSFVQYRGFWQFVGPLFEPQERPSIYYVSRVRNPKVHEAVQMPMEMNQGTCVNTNSACFS